MLACALTLMSALAATAAPLEESIAKHIDTIRAIRMVPESTIIDQYNRQMDEAWKLFSANKAQALPILRESLRKELTAPSPSDLLLLDIGYFVYMNDGPDGKALARDALARANLDAPVVVANDKELFDFLYALAKNHDPAVLPLVDRSFLPSGSRSVYVPQHALKLEGTLMCVFLYGAYGADAEAHLQKKLVDKAVAQRVLEILSWIGTPASFNPVQQAFASEPSFEMLTRATSYMMQIAGPSGKAFMLSLDASKLDNKSKQYLEKIRKPVQETSYAPLKSRLESTPGEKRLTDADLLARLDAMDKNFGIDNNTSPAALLNAGLPTDMLIDRLTAIRSRMLFRLSNEALSDVEVTNAILIALRYRDK